MLQKGDIFEFKEGNVYDVYVKNFPKAFLFDNGDYDFSLTSGELHIGQYQHGLDTTMFYGLYVVTDTAENGGSESEGYPNGHHVYAKKIIQPPFSSQKEVSNFEINFYETGIFTCVIEGLKPISKANIKYVIE